ncbi:MAG: hypothetical protein HKN52_02355 [Eudoraea sp.]|nr:hypothetical protein [Eudoraea sp.]
MQLRRVILVMMLFVFIVACNNDDGPDVETVPPRQLSEVVGEDAAEIQAYLESHFYNYEDFASPPVDFDYTVVLDTIAGANADKIALINQVESITIQVASEDFGLDDGEIVEHTLYYLVAREGDGASPTAADSTFVKYEGSLLNGSLFDATPNYTWQYLPFFLRGYSQAIANFKVGDNIVVNPDGTTAITNSGVGVMFLPSGLAYFNGNQSGIPSYSPLIFKIDVGLYVEDTDYDGDGIPSFMEDLNGDGDVTNDNTDAKEEEAIRSPAFPNHLDPDDDEDGILTKDEIIVDSEGNITFPDEDNDGVPDYLDNDN